MDEDVQSENKKNFYAKFSDKEYYFRLNLYNNEGDVVFLKKNAVLSLVIEDNIFNPFHSGEILISNDMYVLEASKLPYRFLGNGRDILDIEIIPIATGDFDADSQNEEIKKFLGMRFQFVITESTDIIFNNTKCKKLKMIEYAEYMLCESMVNIFSIQSKLGESDYLGTNTQNAKTTGDLIRSIFKVVYGDEDMILKDSNGNEQFEEEYDSLMNVNPYNSMNYYELLMYILQFHTYRESPCILNFDRYAKKFQLISLNTIFSKNEELLQEGLYFAAGGEQKRLTIQWDSSDISFKESLINEFFTDSPTSKYNITLNSNSSLLNVNSNFKTMLFDLKTLNSDNFTKTYFEQFCKPFENLFTSYQIVPNFYLSPNKNNNYHTHESSLPPYLDQQRFMNQKLQSLLYLNNVYQITLDGLTNRQPLTFVDVMKFSDDDSKDPSEWDYANIGRHLITSVRHIFTQDSYRNVVETVKPYRLVNKQNGSKTIDNLLNNFGN